MSLSLSLPQELKSKLPAIEDIEEEFEHESEIVQEGNDVLEITVICPECKEIHTIRLDLSKQELELPKMLKMIKG